MLESGKVQLSLGLADLRALIDRAILASEQVNPQRSFIFHRDTLDESIHLLTDADRLVQV